MIYSSVNYGLGATLPVAAAAPTPAQAMAQLEKMTKALRKWLSYRKANDEQAVTQAEVQRLQRSRRADEQALCDKLYALLMQAGFKETQLPVPDIQLDPNTAVELAELVLSGETPGPEAQGFLWLLIPIAGLAWVISSAIKSQADLAAEKERIRCIESGACTDYGFWLKVGGISLAAYLAWDKFGIKEFFKKKGA